MESRVMVMAGGTGGHVFPALAVADWLRQQGCEIFWLGTARGIEARLIPEKGYAIESIGIRGLRGTGWRRQLAAPFVLIKALWQVLMVLRRRRPNLVLGMGGFVTGPGGLMARLLRIPLVIQEQNAIPGMTNRILAHMSTRVFEAFPGSFDKSLGAETCGNPVRAQICALEPPERRLTAHGGSQRLLVLGGSLGAQALNRVVPEALGRLPAQLRPQVRHQAGENHHAETTERYAALGVTAQVKPFEEDMAEAYGWTDLVICRAGALTVSELAAAGIGSILVPYPHAVDDHQTRNAAWLVSAGAALLEPQADLSADKLARLLEQLLPDRERLLNMARAARRLARADAAALVGRACLQEMRR